MNFLKNFFNNDSTIIGLCAFDRKEKDFCTDTIIDEVLFKNVNFEKTFRTNFQHNTFLRV